jgi:hypothetical protein
MGEWTTDESEIPPVSRVRLRRLDECRPGGVAMSRINEKMGLKPAGARAMMKLPKDRATAVKLTAAKCPECLRTGARLSKLRAGWFVCSWCAHAWEPTS